MYRGSIPFLEKRVTGRDVALVVVVVLVLLGLMKLMAIMVATRSGENLERLERLRKAPAGDIRRVTMKEYDSTGWGDSYKTVEIPASEPLIKAFLDDFESVSGRLNSGGDGKKRELVIETGTDRFSGDVNLEYGTMFAFFSSNDFKWRSAALAKLVEKYFPSQAEAKK